MLGEFLDPGGLLHHVLGDCGEPAVGVRSQAHMLDGGRPVAGEGEHLLARQRKLNGPAVAALGSKGREHHV